MICVQNWGRLKESFWIKVKSKKWCLKLSKKKKKPTSWASNENNSMRAVKLMQPVNVTS